MKRILVTFATLWLTASGTQAAGWEGTWRLVRFHERAVDGVVHLVVSGEGEEGIRAFDSGGTPMNLLQAELGDGNLEAYVVHSFKQPLPLKLEVRIGDGFSGGDWAFFHPQYGATSGGDLAVQRVMEVVDGFPFEALRREHPDRRVDLPGLLKARAPLEDRRAFGRFWDEEIEPVYYFLLHDWMYGDGSDDGLRERRLEEVREALLRDDEQSAFLLDFHPFLIKAREEIESLLQASGGAAWLVSGFAEPAVSVRSLWALPRDPQREEECACKLDLNVRFTMFNALTLSSDREAARLRVRYELIRSALAQDSERLEEAVVRRGLALFLAHSLESRTFPIDRERLPQLKSRLEEDRKRDFQELQASYFPEFSEQAEGIGFQIGYDFAERLTDRHGLEQALRLDEKELQAEWRSYLNRPAESGR